MSEEVGLVGLAVLALLVAFGALVPVVPTGAAVSAAAVVARTDQPWQIALVVAAGTVGAYAGDITMYGALRGLGEPLARRLGWLKGDDPDSSVQRFRATLEENELRTLLVSRLVPGGRAPVLIAAALGGYPWPRFASAAIASAALWATMYAAIGVLGDVLVPGSERVVLVVVVIGALLVGLVVPAIGRLRRA